MNQVPEAFKSVFGFGAPITVHPIRKRRRWGSMIAVVIFLGGAVLAFAYATINTFLRWQKYGPAVVISSLTGPLILALVFFTIGLIATWSAYAGSKKAAVLYSEGIAYRDRKGLRTWRWSDIAAINAAVTKHYTNGIYTGTTHVYTFTNKNGECFTINDAIHDVEKLAGNIRQNIFPLLYQGNADAYNNGQPCTFGPVVIVKSGIQIGKKQYAWDEVEQVGMRSGVLSVKKKDGGWFSGASATAASIPNLEVLLSMIDQIVGIKTG